MGKWVERLEPSIRYIKKSKAERKGDENGNSNGSIRTGKVGRPRKQEIQPQKVVNNSINIKTESENNNNHNNNNNHGNNKTNILIKKINTPHPTSGLITKSVENGPTTTQKIETKTEISPPANQQPFIKTMTTSSINDTSFDNVLLPVSNENSFLTK